jgi:hypothetical protein
MTLYDDHKIQVGDRIRLLVPTLSGWQKTGTVTEVEFNGDVEFTKDDTGEEHCVACAHEIEPA